MSDLLNCQNPQHVTSVSENNRCAYIHSDLLITLLVFFVRHMIRMMKVYFPGLNAVSLIKIVYRMTFDVVKFSNSWPFKL